MSRNPCTENLSRNTRTTKAGIREGVFSSLFYFNNTWFRKRDTHMALMVFTLIAGEKPLLKTPFRSLRILIMSVRKSQFGVNKSFVY